MVDNKVSGLVALSTVGCYGLNGNLSGDGGHGCPAGVPLGQVVEGTARDNDVAAPFWSHSELSVKAMEPPLELADCPVQSAWIKTTCYSFPETQ